MCVYHTPVGYLESFWTTLNPELPTDAPWLHPEKAIRNLEIMARDVQGLPRLHSESDANLNYTRPCLKVEQIKRTEPIVLDDTIL